MTNNENLGLSFWKRKLWRIFKPKAYYNIFKININFFSRKSSTSMLFSCRISGVFDSGVTMNELNSPLNDTSIRRVTWVAADDEL